MTNLDKNTKILIIGLGVIGGGYAKALTDKGYHVKCITKDKKDITYALERGMIEYGTTDLDEKLISESELIIFALYPTTFIKWIEVNKNLFAQGTLITDVTGVKSGIVSRVQDMLPEGVEFIAAHPMAGREKSGVEYSDSEVFNGANYIVVPTERNTPEAIEVCKSLGKVLGFGKISTLTVREHDEMIAFLSQLTHCIAVTLMTSNNSEGLEKYTGDSFRDLTRIAKINENMWCELFLLNKDLLLKEMDAFIESFIDFKRMLECEDAEGLRRIMRYASSRRELFDKPKS